MGREAVSWRAPPALGRFRAAGLESATLLSSVALLTDLRGTSVGGRGRALGAGRGSPTSAPMALGRRAAAAGDGAPEVGLEESFRTPELRTLFWGASGAFPLATDSSAGGCSPFWPTGPDLLAPLARARLETETWPGVLAVGRSPLPTAVGLQAGFRGPTPALRAAPPRAAASAPPPPPPRSPRDLRPVAPAAPRTRRAAAVTGGGGRGDAGGFGVGRPGGREAGARAAAPAFALPLLSIPHLVVIHTIIFMVCTSFWFKFPGTSSKIEHFISILGKCFDSPWTTRALSEVSGENQKGPGTGRAAAITVAAAGTGSGKASEGEKEKALAEPEKVVTEPPAVTLLDKKEGEQAKALFEKVKKFRVHVEEGDILYTMYIRQTVLKVCKFLAILVYNLVYVEKISFLVACRVETSEVTGYASFCCNHTKAHLFSKLAFCYISFVCVYGITCLYTLYWLFHRPLKEYSFRSVREETGMNDIPDVRNDFAFMLHLIDEYDSLYSKRFAVFLSEVSESRLKQLNLNHEWTPEKLRQKLQRNSRGRLELALCMLPGLPDTVFELSEVEALRLEAICDIAFPPGLSQLTNLQELSLLHSPARLPFSSQIFLRDRLKVMRVKCEELREVPLWVFGLRGLEELHLEGLFPPELARAASLESLRELKQLKVLSLRSNAGKVPASVTDVAGHLQRLSLHNDGARLLALNSLKKLAALRELELVACGLERIPHAIFSLGALQELDLKDNHLRSIEEILSFQHCRKLVTLRLWHNQIAYVPEHVRKLRGLEQLYLSHNKLETLPSQLGLCSSLRLLDISHNGLHSLPPEVGLLQNLQHLALSYNALEALPDELFFCRKLRTLLLGFNHLGHLSPHVAALRALSRLELKGNRLEVLPEELGNCAGLKKAGLVVEDTLYEGLPHEVRERMEKE